MWYAVQVATGREETARDMCRKLLNKESYTDIFIIRFDRAKRYYGAWHKEKKIMFPGYMFIDTDNPGDIYEQLKNVPELTKILGREGKDFIHGAGASFQPAGGLRHGLCRADLLCGHRGAPPRQGSTGQRQTLARPAGLRAGRGGVLPAL